MATYGQLVNGKRISIIDFQNEVKDEIKTALGNCKFSIAEINKTYKKGYSVSDAVSYFIMKS